jgi:hypothetical protein
MRKFAFAAAIAIVLVARGASADSYPLDDLDRVPPPKPKKLVCSPKDLVAYAGKLVRFDSAAQVSPLFVPRLERFEAIVRDVGTEVYGRPPRVLHQLGGFACNTTPRGWISEHAFGNALDVDGFTFPALAKGDAPDVPSKLRGPIRVRVAEAWTERAPPEEKRFFRLLLERLRATTDPFRGIIGPPAAGHATHLHLDAGPFLVRRFEAP